MNADQRREARRRRILENPESRLRKITTLSTNEIVSNGHVEPVKDKLGNGRTFFNWFAKTDFTLHFLF